ncbi:MAG: type II toxin-antitoxin system RelE/ParE family toxin [Methanosarcinaceae archaeon]|nr:type II toxin-antitoxin system RelE/ParE family toxin [Methanosarcinaceae archaeon]
MYTLLFDKKFKSDIKKLDKSVRDRILRKVFQLESYPELGKHLIAIDLWSLRIGKYRVLYTIKKNALQVLVLTVDHRRKVYKDT